MAAIVRTSLASCHVRIGTVDVPRGTRALARDDEAVLTQLDPLGDMHGRTAQRYSMTKAPTGQFVHAIGAFDGTAALRSVERAFSIRSTCRRPQDRSDAERDWPRHRVPGCTG